MLSRIALYWNLHTIKNKTEIDKMYIKNFRQYIMEKIAQTKKDQKDTIKDAENRHDKSQKIYQKEYYHGRLQCLKEIYDDCRKYEWKKK